MDVPSIHRAAFWHLVSAGNSGTTALEYCCNLYEFVRNNFIDFEHAIQLIRCKKRTVKQRRSLMKMGRYVLN